MYEYECQADGEEHQGAKRWQCSVDGRRLWHGHSGHAYTGCRDDSQDRVSFFRKFERACKKIEDDPPEISHA